MTRVDTPHPESCVAPRACRAWLVALALFGLALPATAQVYKCVDKAGRITYQQVPCAGTQKEARVDLQLNNGSVRDDDAGGDWAAKAGRKEVGVGMPRAFVVKAYGTPQEMRAGRAQENAAEVWLYRRKDLDLALGFNRGIVVWTKGSTAEGPEIEPDSEPSRRKNFHLARKCAEIEAEAGAPASVYEELDEAMARRVMRHVWEAEPGDRERTVVTCVDGAVARVERIPMR